MLHLMVTWLQQIGYVCLSIDELKLIQFWICALWWLIEEVIQWINIQWTVKGWIEDGMSQYNISSKKRY